MYTTEAGAELLIRGFGGRFAQTAYPWIQPGEGGGYWIDLAAIPDIGAYSSGERGFLLIAASIGSSELQVNLSDAVASLGREQLDLVLAAIAHAAGSHQHSEILYDPRSPARQLREAGHAVPMARLRHPDLLRRGSDPAHPTTQYVCSIRSRA